MSTASARTRTAPRVSVILPTYNRADLLGRAIRSVLWQSLGDLELIIVDDASTDATPGVVASIPDPRVVSLRADQNRGDAASRNLGMAHARGKYLAFQDSDDEWLLDKLRQQVSYMDGLPDDYALVGSPLLRVRGRQSDTIRWPLRIAHADRGEVDASRFMQGGSTYLTSVLVRREAVDTAGAFDEALPINSDWDFCLRLLRRYRFAALDGPALALSHETPGSLSQRDDLRVVAMTRILERHPALLEQPAPVVSRYFHDLARASFLAGRAGDGRRNAWLAARRNPASLRSLALLAVGCFGCPAVRGVLRFSRSLRDAWHG